jgi:hypothetical protein
MSSSALTSLRIAIVRGSRLAGSMMPTVHAISDEHGIFPDCAELGGLAFRHALDLETLGSLAIVFHHSYEGHHQPPHPEVHQSRAEYTHNGQDSFVFI